MARCHSGSIDQYAKTGVLVPSHFTDRNGNRKATWKDGGIVVPRISHADHKQVEIKKILDEAKDRLAAIESRVQEAYSALHVENRKMPKGWLQGVVSDRLDDSGSTLLDHYRRYIDNPANHMAYKTVQMHHTIINQLKKYEESRGVTLFLDNVDEITLRDIEHYYRDTIGLAENTISTRMKRLRSFFRYACGFSKDYPIKPLTRNNPFDRFRIMDEQYGTPYYLTIGERNRLADAELPPRLSVQRDIFVFQCLIGCRISDLWGMTKDNIINGAIEYIPRKTKEGRPVTVRVPLNANAKSIIDRYIGNGDDRLFPFVAQQQYNEDIKEMLKMAGITRMVTILDPKTRMEVKRPINEIATSHMARRTFIGNLYKQVKDPNLIGKLSGHTEGSKAFARYRDIDEDMAKELVSMLE